jgi:hypothetical protein
MSTEDTEIQICFKLLLYGNEIALGNENDEDNLTKSDILRSDQSTRVAAFMSNHYPHVEKINLKFWLDYPDNWKIVNDMAYCAESQRLMMRRCTLGLEVVYSDRDSRDLFLHELEVLLAAKHRILSNMHYTASKSVFNRRLTVVEKG